MTQQAESALVYPSLRWYCSSCFLWIDHGLESAGERDRQALLHRLFPGGEQTLGCPAAREVMDPNEEKREDFL
jgi:hypothetical protein